MVLKLKITLVVSVIIMEVMNIEEEREIG